MATVMICLGVATRPGVAVRFLPDQLTSRDNDAGVNTTATAVYRIADELMRRGAIRSQKLAAAVASVPRRNDPPRIRDIGELSGIAHDPLAHGLAGREDEQ
jgi:hypothetical protein